MSKDVPAANSSSFYMNTALNSLMISLAVIGILISIFGELFISNEKGFARTAFESLKTPWKEDDTISLTDLVTKSKKVLYVFAVDASGSIRDKLLEEKEIITYRNHVAAELNTNSRLAETLKNTKSLSRFAMAKIETARYIESLPSCSYVALWWFGTKSSWAFPDERRYVEKKIDTTNGTNPVKPMIDLLISSERNDRQDLSAQTDFQELLKPSTNRILILEKHPRTNSKRYIL